MKVPAGYEVVPQALLEEADKLWLRSAAHYPVAVVRDSDWLKRRYLTRPNNRYQYVSVRKEGELRAWGVLFINGAVGQWVDLLWDGEDSDALIAVDAGMIEMARSQGATSSEMWMCGDFAATEILKTSGWEQVEHPPKLKMTARSFDSTVNANAILDRIYLTMGDSDLV